MSETLVSLDDFFAALPETAGSAAKSLNLLSFNIQVGIQTSAYHHYLTRSWQHIWPHEKRRQTLQRIAEFIAPFDIVGLQEIDGGSFRSGFVNQVEWLAKQADFPYWYQQTNRNLTPLAKHSNGLLTRLEPQQLTYHALPGLLPGRGAMAMKIGAQHSLLVIVVHLALGRAAQARQLSYIYQLAKEAQAVVIMGDLNNHAEHILTHTALAGIRFHTVNPALHTFPSWSPSRGLDHILVSDNLAVNHLAVLDIPLSDHLPIAMNISWPPTSRY